MAKKGEPITTKFSVDISELEAGIQEAKRQIKLANSQFKAASSGMDNWAKSADGLQAKLHQLGSVQDAENKKLELLKRQYTAVAEKEGENSIAAQELMIDINNQQAAVNRVTSALKWYQSKLNDLNKASEDNSQEIEDQRTAYEKLQDTIGSQEDELKRLKSAYASVSLEQGDNSDTANELAKEIEQLSSELADNKRQMKEAESAAEFYDKSLDDLGDSAEEAEGGFTILKGTVATFVGNLATSAVGALKEWGTNLLSLAESTREYRAEMAKLDSAAVNNGYSADYAKSKYEDLYGVLGDETAANTTISNFMAMGASTETLDSLLNSSMGIWAQYGDSIPLDGLAEAINETAKVGTVTGTLADALNWAGISEDTFNEQLAACTTEQERQQLVADTLNATYGDLASAYQENNASVIAANKANIEYTDAVARMGAKIEPVTTAIRNGFTSILNKGMDLVEGLDMSIVSENVKKGFSTLTDVILPKVVNGFTWIIDHKDPLIAGIAGIAGSFVAFKAASAIVSVVSGISTLFTLIQSGIPIMTALNAVMSANPISIIIMLIAGLVAAFATLWNSSETFRNFWIGLWENIKSVCETVINAIVTFFTVKIPEAINNMLTFLRELPGNILNFLTQALMFVVQFHTNIRQKAIEIGTQFLQFIINFISQLPEKIAYWLGFALGRVTAWGVELIQWALVKIPEFINTIIKFISELPGKIGIWLTTALTNIINWGISLVSTGRQKASEFVNGAIEFIKNLPSKAKEWLDNTISNVVQWGKDMVKEAKEAATNTVNDIVNTLKSLPGKVLDIGKDIVKGIWDGITSMDDWLLDKLGGFIDDVIDGFTDGFEIGSPSKVMKRLAKWVPAGVGEGITENADLATKPMKFLTEQVKKTASGIANTVGANDIKTNLSNQISGIKAKVSGVARSAAQQAQVVKNVTFNQYNNSPKALSRLEIYRQSKNLLKGVTLNV